MIEHKEARETVKPQWLELSEPEKVRHTYWGTSGHMLPQPTPKKRGFRWPWTKPIDDEAEELWTAIFHSKEESEAHASRPNAFWKWDGNPATPRRLADMMLEARRKGFLGVRCRGWDGTQWVTLKEWRAGEPLFGEEA